MKHIFKKASELPITRTSSYRFRKTDPETWCVSVTVKDGEEFDDNEFEISAYASSRQDAEAKAMKLANKVWQAIK